MSKTFYYFPFQNFGVLRELLMDIYICSMKFEKDFARLAKILKSVNDLIALGIMQEMSDKPNIYVFKTILLGKDKKYMKNWCENILTVWGHTFKPTNISYVELNVFDKESGDLICSYSVKGGLKF